MNKVENIEGFTEDSKPLEELSEDEKETQSEMYTDKNPAEPEEDDLEKKSSEDSEPIVETPEEELKEGEEPKLDANEPVKETPKPTPKQGEDTEEDREIRGLKTEQEKLKKQVLDNIVNLRAQKRQQVDAPTPPISQPTSEEEIDPEINQQLNSWADKKGLVSEAEIREKLHQETLTNGMNTTDKEFLSKYPEYLYSSELRDEHDEIVNAIPSKSIEDYKARMDLAHKIVKQNHLDRFPSSSGDDTTKKQALKTAGLGAGSQSAPSPIKNQLDPQKVAEAKSFLKGFSDSEIEEILK